MPNLNRPLALADNCLCRLAIASRKQLLSCGKTDSFGFPVESHLFQALDQLRPQLLTSRLDIMGNFVWRAFWLASRVSGLPLANIDINLKNSA